MYYNNLFQENFVIKNLHLRHIHKYQTHFWQNVANSITVTFLSFFGREILSCIKLFCRHAETHFDSRKFYVIFSTNDKSCHNSRLGQQNITRLFLHTIKH